MNFNIKGHYKFQLHIFTMFNHFESDFYESDNLITSNGVNFFLNRMCNDKYTAINAVALGVGSEAPNEADTKLSNEQARNSPNSIITNNKVYLRTTFSYLDINNTREIGVFAADSLLVSRDVYSTNINIPSGSTISLTYTYSISTGEEIQKWAKFIDKNYVYTAGNMNSPLNIIEDDKNGYIQKPNIEEVETKEGSFYYDENVHTIYIHTSDSLPPSNHTIKVSYS